MCNQGTNDLSLKTGSSYRVLSCDNEWVVLQEQPGTRYKKWRFDLAKLNPDLEKTPGNFDDEWFRNAALMLPVYYDDGDIPKLKLILNTLHQHLVRISARWGQEHIGRPDLTTDRTPGKP